MSGRARRTRHGEARVASRSEGTGQFLTRTAPLVMAMGLSIMIFYRLPLTHDSPQSNHSPLRFGGPNGAPNALGGTANVADALSGLPGNHPLLELLRAQNQTIDALRQRLEETTTVYDGRLEEKSRQHDYYKDLYNSVKDVGLTKTAGAQTATMQIELDATRAELARTATELAKLQREASTQDQDTASLVEVAGNIAGKGYRGGGPGDRRTKFDRDCEDRFGLGLSELWRARRTPWCESPADSEMPSSIHCYPYQQEHKKGGQRRATTDMFCEGRNIFIDFDKVKGRHGTSKPPLGQQYHSFDQGSTFATCSKTQHWNHALFMPHMSLQMRGFKDNTPLPRATDYTVESTTTYLLSRDEDCENMFHSSADHINIVNVARILDLDFARLQVVLFDKHFDGPFHEMIETAFSPNHPLRRAEDYSGKKVLFSHLVWHLESPAGIVFPKVGGPKGLMRCHHSSLWNEFRYTVLKAFNLWDVPPPPVPTVLLSFRRRTKSKNVGRVIANEKELIEVVKSGNVIKHEVVDMATIGFKRQLELVRQSNIYIGAHGAGLMHVMFMPEEAVLVEIHPHYRLDRHFRLASRMSGKIYMPMRTKQQVSCTGSSDSIPVDPVEFRQVVDSAVRIARSFDDGASECGLKCDPRILALDGGNDPHYGTEHKGVALDTRFPCH